MTNGDQALADQIADDMSDFIWRVREPLAGGSYPGPAESVRRMRAAQRDGATPVAVGDYSDRSGDATHLLAEALRQGSARTLFATIRDERVLRSLGEGNVAAGAGFDMDVGGFAGTASGQPVRLSGRLTWLGQALGFEQVAVIEFGEGNAVIVTPALEQITDPESLAFGPLDPDAFEVIVVKSRVHFRRGFDETGYANAIIIADAPGPFVGTIHLDALPYEHVTLTDYYPYGTPLSR